MTTPRTDTPQIPKAGDIAPTFKLPAHPSGEVSLDSFRGKKNVILAFYPKDDTPGCTKEMCSFSEDLSKFQGQDTEVFGVSCDSISSHDAFAKKFNLGITLLADEGGKVGKQYGTVQEGKSTANRVLFIIDKNGIIQYVVDGMPDNAQLLEHLNKIK